MIAALRNKDVPLFSDLAIHRMGTGLTDQINQGRALGDEFRTAPLWGLGKRIFFLHDGRTSNLWKRSRRITAQGQKPTLSLGNTTRFQQHRNKIFWSFSGRCKRSLAQLMTHVARDCRFVCLMTIDANLHP